MTGRQRQLLGLAAACALTIPAVSTAQVVRPTTWPDTPSSYTATVTSPQTLYTPGVSNVFNFTVAIATNGTAEYVDNIIVTFPVGVNVTVASGPSPYSFCGGGQGNQSNPTTNSVQWVTPGHPSGCGAFATGSFTFNTTVAVPVGFSGPLTATVQTRGDGWPPPLTDAQVNNFPITFNPLTADLAITLTDTPDPVAAGTNLTYVATVTNPGPAAATDVAAALPLPAGTTFVSATPTAGGVCTTPAVGANGTINCTWTGATAVAGSVAVTVVAGVPANTAAATVLSATATTASATLDPTPGNNSATTTTTVSAAADLSLTLTDAPDPVSAGANLTYTATVANAGPSDAAGVTVTLPLPTGTSLVSGNVAGGGSCAGAPVVCTVTGNIAPGGSRVATIVVAVAPSVLNAAVLTATATAGATTPDANAANNSATTTTAVSATADLLLGFSASATQALVNVPVTFTATSLNQGPSDAQTVVVTVTLTPDFRYSSFTAAGATCTTPQVGTTGAIVCTWAGATAPGVTRTLAVVAYSNSEGTAAVNASTSSATTDPVANNNLGNLGVVVGFLVQEIPTLGNEMLILLGLMLGLVGFVAVRRQA